MADTHLDPVLGPAADANAEALARGAASALNSPDFDSARENALDEAFASESAKTPPASDPAEFGRENGGVPQRLEGEPEPTATPAAQVEPAAAPAAETPTPVSGKGLLEDLTATPESSAPATPAPGVDPYGDVKLRSDASPKTRETFEQLKSIARQREEAANTARAETEKKLSDLEAQLKELQSKPVPEDIQGELKELREFRAQFDTANDPQFKERFDTRINSNYDSIYGKLAAHGLPTEELAKLKGFSTAQRDAAIENFLSKLPSADRRFIEAQLLDNVKAQDDREKALGEARTNAEKILAERKNEPAVKTAQRDHQVATMLKPALAKLSWIHLKEIAPTAAPEEKKRLEAENAFATRMQEALRSAIVDDSPATRAEAAIAVPLAHYYRQAHATEKARADALQARLANIQAASTTSRTARSAASAAPAPAPVVVHAESGDALDELFAQASNRT